MKFSVCFFFRDKKFSEIKFPRMKIHHIRNATFLLQASEASILVDPMLGPKHSRYPLSFIRHKFQKNPTVDLPKNAESSIQNSNFAMITHAHSNHLDKEGLAFLIDRNIPVICSPYQVKYLRREGLKIHSILAPGEKISLKSASIIGVPCQHGSSIVGYLMGKALGFYIDFLNGQSFYMSSDTILTKDVEKVLRERKPKLSIIPCGGARLDVGKHIMMNIDEIVKFIELAPGKVYANHMDSLNNCPITREILKKKLNEKGLLKKVFIPEDGESFEVQ